MHVPKNGKLGGYSARDPVMALRIHMYGDPVLREKAAPVEKVDDTLRQLAGDMIDAMHAARGIGLAAQQVGKVLPLFVVNIPAELDTDGEGNRLHPDVAMPMVLVNPEITYFSEERTAQDEGCLSFPDLSAPIIRPCEIEIKYLDREGKPCLLKAQGLLARAIQHELDHLNGILFIDRMSQVKRIALGGRLKRLRKDTEQKLGQSR
jgi:peptide deformylase